MAQNDQLLLIDLSGIAHQIWHVSGNEPDPAFVSTQVIARVRALASAHPYTAVCCDDGKSFRADIDPTYKANRDTENRAPLRHQMDIACETLRKDGFPIWRVKGFEADDIIATAVYEALKIDGATAQIASADKDLLQLVNDRVTMKKITDGAVMGPADVVAKFKVTPAQMGDYLCLVGDVSDNVIGAKGIGGVTAAKLLAAHGSIKAIYEAMQHGVVKELTPSLRSSMVEFQDRWPTVTKLIALRTDAPIPFSEIASERTAPPMEDTPTGDDFVGEQSMSAFMEQDKRESDAMRAAREPFKRGADSNDAQLPQDWTELGSTASVSALSGATAKAAERIKQAEAKGAEPSPVDRQAVLTASGPLPPAVYAAPVDFSQQLEPRNMDDAVKLAQRMYESRLFGAYGTPQAVLATVLAGRELGIPAMASLRAFHIIEGKPQMSAGTIQSLVLKSGKATYFRCSERTALKATFVTRRGDEPEMSLTYTIEEGRQAWPKDDGAWSKSGWGRNPADMLVARASSKLARLVYPDVVSGLYAPEEMD